MMHRVLTDATTLGEASTLDSAEWQKYVTIVIVAVGLFIMFKEWVRAEFAMMGMLVALMWTRVLDSEEAIEGFGSTSVLTVMVLLGMAEGISQTGALTALFHKFLGRPTTHRAALIRLCVPVTFCSAFLNNTPIVAIMIPIVLTWSRVIKMPPSLFMLPLSYVSELGGVCTLIGTSTNLVVKDLYDRVQAYNPELPRLTIFSQTRYGLPVALSGVLYIVLVGVYLLPAGPKPQEKSSDVDEEEPIQVGMLVTADSPAVGHTANDLGLAHQNDLWLTHVNRDGVTLPTHNIHNLIINVYDELYITGDLTQVDALAAQLALKVMTDEHELEEDDDAWGRPSAPLTTQHPLLEGQSYSHASAARGVAEPEGEEREAARMTPTTSGRRPSCEVCSCSVRVPSHGVSHLASNATTNSNGSRGLTRDKSLSLDNGATGLIRLVHVTVKDDAPIAYRTIKNVRFRTRFDAAVVDLRRGFRRVRSSLGHSVLKPGDQLMLDVGNSFDASSADTLANFTDIRLVKAPAKQFMMALEVIRDSPLQGKTLEEAGLRGMGNAFVSLIQRGSEKLHAVGPTVQLEAGDVLWVAGNSDAVYNLRNKQGLRPYGTSQSTLPTIHREIIQAALSWQSPFIGQRVHEANLEQFNATLLAVHRSGICLPSLSDVRLQAGDVLLLEGSSSFVKEHKDDEGFTMLSVIEGTTPVNWNLSILALVLVIALVVAQVTQNILLDKPFIGLLPLSSMVVVIMLVTRCMSPTHLHKALKWDLYITIAAAIGVSHALEDTGVAAMIADGLITVGKRLGGDAFVMGAMYIAAALLSNVVANNAAAALLFPIAVKVANHNELSLEHLAYLVMFGASSAFMTPYGYQTNLMVQGVGGYSAVTYLRFGAPLQFWQALVTLAVIATHKYWYISWLVVAVLCVAVFTPFLAPHCPPVKAAKRVVERVRGRVTTPREARMDGFSENQRFGMTVPTPALP